MIVSLYSFLFVSEVGAFFGHCIVSCRYLIPDLGVVEALEAAHGALHRGRVERVEVQAAPLLARQLREDLAHLKDGTPSSGAGESYRRLRAHRASTSV